MPDGTRKPGYRIAVLGQCCNKILAEGEGLTLDEALTAVTETIESQYVEMT